MGARFSTPVQTGPGAQPASCTMGTGSFPGGKERAGRDADFLPPSSAVVMKEWSYTSTPPVGRTACTEPQCLYKGALYLYLYLLLNHCTIYYTTTRNCRIREINKGRTVESINPLNPELNTICYLLALLGAHHFLHVSRIRVKLLTLRRLMSYI